MKRIGFAALLLVLLSVQAFAVEKIVPPSAFPKDKSDFEVLNKDYLAKRDNPYLLGKLGVGHTPLNIKPFLLRPDASDCSSLANSCVRKKIFADSSFTVLSIVQPEGGEIG